MLVLEGPPGTGKTFLAAREAVKIIDGALPASSLFPSRYQQLVADGRIVPVTFHPSYSYEDFVEGYRPRMRDGVMDYQVVPGPFLRAVEKCRSTPSLSTVFSAGMTVPASNGEPYVVDEVDPGGLVLKRHNNRADAVNQSNYFFAPFWFVNRIIKSGISNAAIGGSQYEEKQQVARALQMAPDQLAGASHIMAVVRYVQQRAATVTSENHDVVLLIDEVNRADLSRVFGELLTLLEADKREGAPEARSAILPYSGMLLNVPASLHVVATMNTADRSLSVFDYALRRRFDFRYIAPDPSLCPVSYGGIDVRAWLSTTNHRIAALLDREACLGHAEFMEGRLESRRMDLGEPETDQGRQRALAQVILEYALPTLLALNGRDWSALQAILGPSLIEAVDTVDLAIDDFDIPPLSYRLRPECDPSSDVWHPGRFRAAIQPTARVDIHRFAGSSLGPDTSIGDVSERSHGQVDDSGD